MSVSPPDRPSPSPGTKPGAQDHPPRSVSPANEGDAAKTIGLRPLGNSPYAVRPVALGCWPMSGISSLDVDDAQSVATVQAAYEAGINHFDTAYSYGYDGRSDAVLRQGLGKRIHEVVVASKVGTHYDSQQKRIIDGSPERLFRQADELRGRLGLDRIPILYLHTPDPQVPVERSAEAMAQLVQRGWVAQVGLSNASLDETERFARVIEPCVVQPPFNMLQPEAIEGLLPYLKSHRCGVAAYWPLMKGLLAGGMTRDHVLAPQDKRRTYAVFQGEAWHRAHDLLDVLRTIASHHQVSVAAVVVHWTMRQPWITTVLCGAKRPEQIVESASAMSFWLDNPTMEQIDLAVRRSRTTDGNG